MKRFTFNCFPNPTIIPFIFQNYSLLITHLITNPKLNHFQLTSVFSWTQTYLVMFCLSTFVYIFDNVIIIFSWHQAWLTFANFSLTKAIIFGINRVAKLIRINTVFIGTKTKQFFFHHKNVCLCIYDVYIGSRLEDIVYKG